MIATLLALLAVVNSPVSTVSYSCNGITAVYAVNYPYLAYTDLVVTSTTAGGAVTTLVYTTDYTVNMTSTSSTATLTLNTPATSCPSGNTLQIARVLAFTQPTSFKMQTTFNSNLHEIAYDRLSMQIAQLSNFIVDPPLTGIGTLASHLACPLASSVQSGCLSVSDWNTFNNKATNGVSLSSQNTWTGPQIFAPGAGFPNSTGVTSSGIGSGTGGVFTGGTTGYGLKAIEGAGHTFAPLNIQPTLGATGNPTGTLSDGDIWFNANTTAMRARTNGVTYTLAPLKAGTTILSSGTPSTATVNLGYVGMTCTCTAVTTAADNANLKCSVSSNTLTITGPNTNTNTFAYTCMVTQ